MIYEGNDVSAGEVRIGRPAGAPESDDKEWLRWWSEAQAREDIIYFGIWEGEREVGQIFLHDIDRATSSGMIGYHIFREGDRGRGIGSSAFRLLGDYAWREAGLNELVIITGKDNEASRRLAEGAGFRLSGVAREHPERDVVYRLSLSSG